MALFITTISATPSLFIHHSSPPRNLRRPGCFPITASISSSSHSETPTTSTSASSKPIRNTGFNYTTASPNGTSNAFDRFAKSSESNIERVIFDFRFFALFAVGGSLAGSLLCFLNVLSPYHLAPSVMQ